MNSPLDARAALRQRLLTARAAAVEPPALQQALAQQLCRVLAQLEPQVLGLYAAIRGEFNALAACTAEAALAEVPFALPFSFRQPPRMDYRLWPRGAALPPDECGVPASRGAVVVPDVLVVPCVGYTACGFRLGYGGGYFDRYLAAHSGVTAIGLALSSTEMNAADFAPQAHDLRLTLIVTECGVT